MELLKFRLSLIKSILELRETVNITTLLILEGFQVVLWLVVLLENYRLGHMLLQSVKRQNISSLLALK